MKLKPIVIRSLIVLALLFSEVMRGNAIELLISDSGRNSSWTPKLEAGDGFGSLGADNKPVGGVFNLSSPIGQLLLPMPQDSELSGMNVDDEKNRVNLWSELIRDRVSIAVMNREPNFEIRLLQNTPGEKSVSWDGNPNADRFARIAYASIEKCVSFLKDQGVPVKITAALADTGAGTFARAVKEWRPYASAFRRADMVQGRAGLEEMRETIDALGAGRVRIFIDPSKIDGPAMSISHLEVDQALMQDTPGLTLFRIVLTADVGATPSQRGADFWFNLLSGFSPVSVKRLTGDALLDSAGNQSQSTSMAASFRDPLVGWDPENNRRDTLSLASEGVVAPSPALSIQSSDGDPVKSSVIATGTPMSTAGGIANGSSQPSMDGLIAQRNQAQSDLMANFHAIQFDNNANNNIKQVASLLNYGAQQSLPIAGAMIYKNPEGGAFLALGGSIMDNSAKVVQAVTAKITGDDAAAHFEKMTQDEDTLIKLNAQIQSSRSGINPTLAEPKMQSLYCGTSEHSLSDITSITKSWSQTTGTKLVDNPTMNLQQMSGSLKEQFQTSSDFSKWTFKTGPVPGAGVNVCTEQPMHNSWQAPMSFTPPSQQFLNQDLKFSAPNNMGFMDTSLNVKGVLLQGAAHVEGAPVSASELGLVYQDSSGVTDLSKLQRFETALWAAYFSVQGPGISIDPVDTHFNKHHVRHIGNVRSTELATIMRETDYMMKRWAIGTYRPNIPGFMKPDDYSEETGHRVLNRPSRFWLIPEGLSFTRAGGMLVFSAGRMTVQTEYLDDNPNGVKNPENERFAEWFTTNYGVIASYFPIYQDLFEYAQLVSLGTYLREQKMPLLWFLLRNREMLLTEKAIDFLPALTKKSDYKWYVNISGGVQLDAADAVRDPSRISDNGGLTKSLAQAQAVSGSETNQGEQLSFSESNTTYTVSQAGALSVSGTSSTGDTVQTDFSHFDNFAEKDGTNMWKLATPGLEIVRFYRPEIHSSGQVGPGWHIAVPFHLTVGPPQGGGSRPSRIEVHNNLSGEMESLKLPPSASSGMETAAYFPDRKNGLLTNGIITSSGWFVQDCLGANLWFDSDGDLTRMDLRPDTDVPIKLGQKHLDKVVPGYSVRYRYSMDVNGKKLASIEQGKSKAVMQWDVSTGTPRIAGIEVNQADAPDELIKYQYGSDGRLSAVQTRGGIMTLRYQNDGMQVLARSK